MLDEGIAGDAIAPFFHVAEIIERPIFRQTKLFQGCKGVDHGWGRAFFVARAEAVNDTVLELALEGGPLPLGWIGNADGVDVAVIEQCTGAAADTPQDVAH